MSVDKTANRLLVLKSQLEGSVKTMAHPDPVSSHVLDTSSGFPANEIPVTMFKWINEEWIPVNKKFTNNDGRASAFLSWDEFNVGRYKMHFQLEEYFKRKGTISFYPYAEIVFDIRDNKAHYHIPLLLSPYGYTTYRGS